MFPKTILHHPDPIDNELWVQIEKFIESLPLPSPFIIVFTMITVLILIGFILVLLGIKNRN
ncbi:MAG: hypothetical protein CL778_01265 [Chloroflexi bacterium]|nr:hypothetical protein [Chloroflexota bacterium]|tara:strand:+ start:15899 stop:16081 length:183 start_codon:yes stop_codon:yes gene_type:complete